VPFFGREFCEALPVLTENDGVGWVFGVIFCRGGADEEVGWPRQEVGQGRDILGGIVSYAGDLVAILERRGVGLEDRDLGKAAIDVKADAATAFPLPWGAGTLDVPIHDPDESAGG
jgi:hypothetical protein